MITTEVSNTLRQYYSVDAVRARIVEFLGGTFLNEATSVYIIGRDVASLGNITAQQPEELPGCLDKCCEVSRSLWDRNSILAHLDIEYVNLDFPGEPYLNPGHIYEVQHSVVIATQQILLEMGIAPLHLLTGRGHHFLWAIQRESLAFYELAQLGRLSPTLERQYLLPHPPRNESVEPDLARAFAGLGLVMEYLGHLVKQRAAPKSSVPIQLTEVEVGYPGTGDKGRELVSIDLSEYSDPLHTRHIRVPFSAYLKPLQNRSTIGEHVIEHIPLIFQIPLFEMSETEAIDVMRNPGAVIELARRASVYLPDRSFPTQTLIARYRGSSLASFHDWYYQEEQHSTDQWESTYDRAPLESFPSCVRHILQEPNDFLLKPAGIQHVVRVLMALGWHPRHIAGLIRSKYERDFGWGERWTVYNPSSRADGYTRLFAGLIATNDDRLIDFNCASNREKGYCFQEECGHNLADYRDTLEARRNHERLGCWPFNRLLLPDEHL